MFKSIGANWILTALNIVSAYILMPYTVKTIGPERYGVWLLITSMAGYLSLLLVGTPMAAVKFISAALREKGDTALLESTLAIFKKINFILFAAGLIGGLLLYMAFINLYIIPTELLSETELALAIVFISTAGGFLLQLPYSVMAAHGHFVLRNKILSLITLFKLSSTLLLLGDRPLITTLAIIHGSAFTVEALLSWGVFKRFYEESRSNTKTFDKLIFKNILSFGHIKIIFNSHDPCMFSRGSRS